MTKDLHRGKDRWSIAPDSWVPITRAGWTVYHLVQDRRSKFPLFARLLGDAYEDSEIAAGEVPSLKWEAEQLIALVEQWGVPLKMGLLTATADEVKPFLSEVRRLAEEAAAHGEGIFATAD